MPAFVDLTLDDSDIDMDDAPSGETSAAPGASDEHGAGTANPPPGPELTAHGEDILENIPPDLATVSASATGGSLLPEVSDITEEAARSENIDAPEPEEAPTAAPPPVEIKTEEIDPLVDECASAKIMSIERLNLAFIVKNDRIRCLFCLREKPRNERNATPKWPLDVPLVGLAQHFRKAHPHYAQKLEDMTDDEVLQIS
ncbi:hypothetical protein PLICRDRAFT_401527 [Plicaturopsis crispa FD-325 SS-3]|nr:hypothetical protein PLICRDRAFT_401527 [Plicaturopsis crispa FD-325 SS-3]